MGRGRENGTARESAELQKDFIGLDGFSLKKAGRGDLELHLAGIRYQLKRGAAEELLAALSREMRPYAGYSIFDRIMQDLDAVIDRLMSEDGEAEDERDPGRAEAYCRVLATIRNPYQPDYEAERERQMLRWQARNLARGEAK